MCINRKVLFLIFATIVCGQRQTATNNVRRCAYTFLTESAICGSSNFMRDIAREFQADWKHIKVIAYTGTFSLAGLNMK